MLVATAKTGGASPENAKSRAYKARLEFGALQISTMSTSKKSVIYRTLCLDFL